MSKSFPEWWKHGQKVRTASDGILTLNISEDAEYWLTNDAGKEVSVFSADILGPASTPEACRMTDITELTQRLATCAKEDTYPVLLPADCGALVEALYRHAQPAQTGVDDDVRNIIGLLETNEWAEHCTETVLGSRLEAEITRLVGSAQPAPTCEPITATDDMAYAFHHALTDSMLGADEVEEIKTGLRAVFANLTAPIVSAKYPERLPCSVLLEPGLRFGKGIKTSTVLAALARRAVYESDMAALSPEEKAEFQARIEDFKSLIAQPAPVVPDEMLCDFYEVNNWPDLVRELVKHVEQLQDSAKRNVKPWEDTFPETLLPAYIERIKQADEACRAAMLQAGNSPAHSGLRPAQNSVSPEQDGHSPVIPDGWIPVSERMPESNGVYFGWDGKRVLQVNCFFGGWSANQFIHGEITHWMPLPSAPQEVK